MLNIQWVGRTDGPVVITRVRVGHRVWWFNSAAPVGEIAPKMAQCIVYDLLRDARHDGQSAASLLHAAQLRKMRLVVNEQPDERRRLLLNMAIELVIDRLFAEAVAEAINKGDAEVPK